MKVTEIAWYCVIVSLLWGVTNPLIKKSTKEIVKIEHVNFIFAFANELFYLVSNLKYMVFFCINQCGSVLFIHLLQKSDLSLVVPAVNALTFLVTAVVGVITKENVPGPRSSLGIVIIMAGITLCIIEKL